MAPHAGLCDLNDRHCDIGAMVGNSLAVDQQVGQINSQFRTAFAFAKSVNMFISYRSGEIVNDFFKRFNIQCKFGTCA